MAEEARYEPLILSEGQPMTAIAVIAVFIGIFLLMNVVDFGRLD